jgi:hypothetical protein
MTKKSYVYNLVEFLSIISLSNDLYSFKSMFAHEVVRCVASKVHHPVIASYRCPIFTYEGKQYSP